MIVLVTLCLDWATLGIDSILCKGRKLIVKVLHLIPSRARWSKICIVYEGGFSNLHIKLPSPICSYEKAHSNHR